MPDWAIDVVVLAVVGYAIVTLARWVVGSERRRLHRNAAHSWRRVEAIAEVSLRYSATLRGLGDALEEVLPRIDHPEAHARLDGALKDAQAQIAAADDMLDRAMSDLPEGQGGTVEAWQRSR